MHRPSALAALVVVIGTTALRARAFVPIPPARTTYRRGVSVSTLRGNTLSAPLAFPNKRRHGHELKGFFGDGNKEDTSSSAVATEEDSITLALNDVTGEISSSLKPLASVLNEATDGWALTYADLTPETESTPAGISFLATNVAYAIVGFLLTFKGDAVLGFLTEIAGVFSFLYHFCQLKLGPNQAAVRVALLVDYIVAGAAIVTTSYYLVTCGFDRVPIEGLIVGALGVLSLSLSWVWEVGYPYLFFHSIWHLLSAYAGYVVGQAHLSLMQ